VLNVLRQADAIAPSHPKIQGGLNLLWTNWDAAQGLTHSTALPTYDLDDTATAFMVLDWAGYAVRPEVFASYERETHFICFSDETDPSLSAHIRLLRALGSRSVGAGHEAWIAKILAFIQDFQVGHPWTDKWHASPYYVYGVCIPTLQPFDRELTSGHVRYILASQREDGGWGYFGKSTAEETAYAFQALLYWQRHVGGVDLGQLGAAAGYLSAHRNDRHTALWIGKCLYTPPLVVQAAILSALYSYSTL